MTTQADVAVAPEVFPRREAGRIRSMVDIYLSTARMAIQAEFQYRTGHYFFLLGMVAEPVIYLVVWTTIADQQGGSVQGLTAGYFAAYYIVWTLVRNMNIVFGAPYWEYRIREGELNRDLLRPVLPLHYDIAWFAGWKVVTFVLWIPIAIGLSLVFDPTLDPRPGRDRDFRDRDLGRVPHPHDAAGEPRHALLLDDTRGGDLRSLHDDRAPALRAPRPDAAHARLGAGDRSLPAVPVGLLLPDREPRRRPLRTRSSSAGSSCSCSGSSSGLRSSASPGGSRSVATRRSEAEVNAIRVSWLFFKLGVLNEMQYRVNFFVALFQAAIALVTGLVVLALVYSHTDELNGWSQSELLCLLGIQILMGGLIKMSIQPNMTRLIEDVREGKLDFALTKPEDAQVLVSVREVRIWSAVDSCPG